MFRELPGISQCLLWQDLNQRAPSSLPPLALVTDVGNDLLYGASVDQIIEWLETCFDRLAGYGAELVLTLLPAASVLRLPPWRYYVCRSILFPFHWTPWPEAIQLVHDLDARLRIVGNRYGAQLVEPRGEWYGFDPIHIRGRCRVQAWHEILSRWPSSKQAAATVRHSESGCFPKWRLRPAERRMFGRDQTTSQPVFESARMSISLY